MGEEAAVDQMARTAALELAEHRIRVNLVHPGWTDTPGERRFANGETLKEIDVLGKSPTNLCFGGPDGRTVYVTEDGKLWTQMSIAKKSSLYPRLVKNCHYFVVPQVRYTPACVKR